MEHNSILSTKTPLLCPKIFDLEKDSIDQFFQ